MTRAWDEIANAVTTVITPTPWRADDAVRIMADERVTVAQGVPTQWALMLATRLLGRPTLGRCASRGPGRRGCRGDGRRVRHRSVSGRGALHLDRVVARDRHDAGAPTRRWRPRSAGRSPGSSSPSSTTRAGRSPPDGRPGQACGPGRPCVGTGDRAPGRGRAVTSCSTRGHGQRPGARRLAHDGRLRTAHPARATSSCRAGPTSATSVAATTSTRPRWRRPSRVPGVAGPRW